MDDFLEKALDRLGYEWNIFHETSEYLQKNRDKRDMLSNAVLESFLIHARLIHEFLIKANWKDNLKADELVDDVDLWKQTKPSLFPNLGRTQEIGKLQYKNGWYDLIHKYLAHLSRARISFKPKWPVTDIYSECKDALGKFIICLGDKKRSYLVRKYPTIRST